MVNVSRVRVTARFWSQVEFYDLITESLIINHSDTRQIVYSFIIIIIITVRTEAGL